MRREWKVEDIFEQLENTANKKVFSMGVKSLDKMDFDQMRAWYQGFVSNINSFNKQWELEGVDVRERARRCSEIRHTGRMVTRDMMERAEGGKELRKLLEERDLQEYGNKDGPTFEIAFNKAKTSILKDIENKGITVDNSSLEKLACQAVIDGAQKTNKYVDSMVSQNISQKPTEHVKFKSNL